MSEDLHAAETTRRDVLRKGAFIAPAILTLAAVPSFASAGSWGGETDRVKGRKPKKEKVKIKDKD